MALHETPDFSADGTKRPRTIEEEFSRYKEPNPMGLTPLEMNTRDLEIKKYMKEFPDVSHKMIEWTIDLIRSRPIEETRKMINSGELENYKTTLDQGGTVENAMSITMADGTPVPEGYDPHAVNAGLEKEEREYRGDENAPLFQ